MAPSDSLLAGTYSVTVVDYTSAQGEIPDAIEQARQDILKKGTAKYDEINNIDMQVSLVASGVGLGLIPARFLASHPRRGRLERMTRSGISIEASIVFMQAGHLGRLEQLVPRRGPGRPRR